MRPLSVLTSVHTFFGKFINASLVYKQLAPLLFQVALERNDEELNWSYTYYVLTYMNAYVVRTIGRT